MLKLDIEEYENRIAIRKLHFYVYIILICTLISVRNLVRKNMKLSYLSNGIFAPQRTTFTELTIYQYGAAKFVHFFLLRY